ncbi:MAG TPA: 2-C-methyl-D-erythritol 4-phosphate cytidylyltransferase [Acidimicrobiales bacterium]|nr:2-C-methyl-D-erythritol 4-phosphate cytidylyltransferase [Acidimicrobiales bacterium]
MTASRTHAPGPVWGIVVAAGAGERFGGPKQWAQLGGRSLAAISVASCRRACEGVVLVVPADTVGQVTDASADIVAAGGSTRAASVRKGLSRVPAEATVVVVHDAVRPAASPALFARVIDEVRSGAAGAVPGLPVTDTLKQVEDGAVTRTLERRGVVAVQTPQAFDAEWLRRAHATAGEATDDAALVEQAGGRVIVVDGEPGNLKVTRPEDLDSLRPGPAANGLRIGHGFDVHAWATDARPLVLGGVTFPGNKGLAGHSDADVVCHALADAALGAAGLGDLGTHFPDSDPQWSGARSTDLLAEVVRLAAGAGWKPLSADVTVVAEQPRISTRVAAMQTTLTHILGAPVSIKATTTEGLGALGRGEGIAAWAVTLLASA